VTVANCEGWWRAAALDGRFFDIWRKKKIEMRGKEKLPRLNLVFFFFFFLILKKDYTCCFFGYHDLFVTNLLLM